MAATVTWEKLRELAGFRAENGCAISLYLDLDPRVSPTAGDAQTRVNALLSEGSRGDGAKPTKLNHDQRQALKKDFERIERFFDQEFSRDGAHGFAVFCAGLDNLWHPLPLTEPVPDAVRIGRELHLTPLVPLVGRGDGAIVAVVGREQGQLYRLQGGALRELADHSEEQPGQHDQGGWSQARFQRHIDNLVQDHLREVAEELDRHARRLGARIVVVCSEDTRPDFAEVLPSAARDGVIGWTQAEAHAAPAELLEAAKPVLREWRHQQERELLERWREEAGRGGRASSGWEKTLEAASDGRVEILVYSNGAERPAWQCPACGRLAASAGSCPLHGTRLEESSNGLDLAVHQTLGLGGTVAVVQHHQDLDPVEGIGAILRY